VIFLKKIWVLVIACLVLAACGYRFSGHGEFPFGIKRVCILVFENRTSQMDVEKFFGDDLINEFLKDKRVTITGKDEADAVLAGVIKSMERETISRRGSHQSAERRVRLVMDLTLTNTEGQTLWRQEGLSDSEAYDVAADKVETEQNLDVAIKAISKRLAERIYQSLEGDF